MKKQIFALFLSTALAITSAPAVFAEQPSVVQAAEQTASSLDLRNGIGKNDIAEGTAHFVTENTTLPRSMVVPKGAMLVVEEGILIVPKGTTLTVEGALVVHDGAKLNVKNGGALEISETGVAVTNGTLAISKGGDVRNAGYLQAQGAVNVKGSISTADGGVFSALNKPVMKGGTVSGYSLTAMEEMRYFADKLDWKRNFILVTDVQYGMTKTYDGTHVTTYETARYTAHTFESVLYERCDAPAEKPELLITAEVVGESENGCAVAVDGTTTRLTSDGTELVYKPVLGAVDKKEALTILWEGENPGAYQKPDAYVAKDGTEYYVSSLPYLFCRDSEGKAHNIAKLPSENYSLRCVKSLDKLKLIDQNITIDATIGCAEIDEFFNAEEVYLTKAGKVAAIGKADMSVIDFYAEGFANYEPFTKEQLEKAAKKYGADSFYTIYILSPSAL